ncbi:ADC synthase [Blakeslea trispora]|nr:ADC synthase [Blakeslea trispora]
MIPSTNDSLKHIKTLIIDNYDSYTFNLLQLFDNQSNVVVIRNDQFSWSEFVKDILPHFDNIVISPGPGRPDNATDFGICTQLLQVQLDPTKKEYHRPVFGVCLGHQGIGHLLGGKVTYAPRIMHGRMSQVFLPNRQKAVYQDVLHGCPSPFWAVRYHSLVVDRESLPDDLILTGFCYENDADMDALKHATFLADDNCGEEKESTHHYLAHPSVDSKGPITIMAFQHKSLPIWGVQFHPESVSTEYGACMISNFQQQTLTWMINTQHRSLSTACLNSTVSSYSAAIPQHHITILQQPHRNPVQLLVKPSCPGWVDPEAFVDELLSIQPDKERYISWLDSSRKASPYSQMSILSLDPAMTMTYSTLHRQLTTLKRNQDTKSTTLLPSNTTFFDYLSDLLEASDQVTVCPVLDQQPTTPFAMLEHNTLSFKGGLIGYLGYEMKRESMAGYSVPDEQQCHCEQQPYHEDGCCRCSQEPDAAFQLIDRFMVFDLVQRQVYLCCLVGTQMGGWLDNKTQDAMCWIDGQERQLLQVAELIRRRKLADEFISLTPASSARSTPVASPSVSFYPTIFTPDAEHEDYLKSIQDCVHQIKEGESYELCLTTRFRLTLPKSISVKHTQDPTLWRLYTRYLRKNNPAPFSALLMFPQLGILSSSPERFLKVSQDHVAEMKPIKGTVARVLSCVCDPEDLTCDMQGPICQARQITQDRQRQQQLWQDVKERAENLMIVDLIRNDLAQVCEPSTVRVPKLMHVETYERVHHLVSTVRGQLRPDVNSVQAVKTCFPPGSMTGAPKLRSVQILDRLEGHRSRGIYSGCLGYFSLDGSADFNVVIRTAVMTHQLSTGTTEVSVGGGGAITFLSDPEQEWKETLLKTKSVAPSVKEFLQEQ